MSTPFLTDEEALAKLREMLVDLRFDSSEAKALNHAVAVLAIRIEDRKAVAA